MPIQQWRSRKASLWQSALDEAAAKESGGGAAALGGPLKPMTTRPLDQEVVLTAIKGRKCSPSLERG